jgi:hypothetical protein
VLELCTVRLHLTSFIVSVGHDSSFAWETLVHAAAAAALVLFAGTPIAGEYIVVYKPDVNDVAAAAAE